MWSPSFNVIILGVLVAKLLQQQHSLVPDCAQAGDLDHTSPSTLSCCRQREDMEVSRISSFQDSNSGRLNTEQYSQEDEAERSPSPPTTTANDGKLHREAQEQLGPSYLAAHHRRSSSTPHPHYS
ncbi:hypothetical protein GOP47_0020866 [Adiantum capillus-veneris]|uniref:Uncharacterized protein n=1 Tax=Adiantum capillus-veneris TaxID=13818 RepID=A0A9D4Z940_ADICA|nr:hypothetical protein GOP47_0020866 [Adiantum capillus-veneris]